MKKQITLSKRSFNRLFIANLGLLAVFIIINLTVYGIFINRTYPNAHINNVAVGSTTYTTLAKKMSTLNLLPASITLGQNGKKSIFSLSDLGIKINSTQTIRNSKKKSWLPIANFFISHNANVAININRYKLNNELSCIASQDQKSPVNSHIELKNNGFVLAIKQSANQVIKAINLGIKTVNLSFSKTVPAIQASTLKSTLHKLDAEDAVTLNYTYNGKTTKVSPSMIASWYALTSNSFALQATKVQDYISQIGTTYGIHVQNLSAATNSTVLALHSISRLNYALTATPTTVCSKNSLSQLIVVSISQQHMWACQTYNQVYDSPVTTGAYEVAGDTTPTGTWHIYSKQTDTHLIGPTWDDYVHYWMPFYSDYGFHDATWQTFPFGGPEYPTQGSHGCVHLPLSNMAWLYNWAKIGTTVTITN
jgi:hypothetical protein